MKNELGCAVDFLTNFVRKNADVSTNQTEVFSRTLLKLLKNHYQNHWFPAKPTKGSAYRCIRINGQMDPLVHQAGADCELTGEKLRSVFPSELTLWVDPGEVSYRIGEEGSIGVCYEEEKPQVESQPTASPSASPVPNSTASPARSPIPEFQSLAMDYSGNFYSPNMTSGWDTYAPWSCRDQYNRNYSTSSPLNFNMDFANSSFSRQLAGFVSS
ncbi:protein BTG2 [Lingula anatina]|uniref:Protein BTG2 n=1 Tax=Lingula anatina TaxID=7574 RepID=A0A1S3JY48_LINAN|nr:protein BTG2 [Lingula anatina]|eukprot:XP_013414976.1 protein BTG2 [Lingula anatina]